MFARRSTEIDFGDRIVTKASGYEGRVPILGFVLAIALTTGVALHRIREDSDSIFHSEGDGIAPHPLNQAEAPATPSRQVGRSQTLRLVNTAKLSISNSTSATPDPAVASSAPAREDTAIAEEDLPSTDAARGLADHQILLALRKLPSIERASTRHARLRDLLDEIDRRRLISAAPVLLDLSSIWEDSVGRMLIFSHLTSLGEFAGVPYATRAFDRTNPPDLRHSSTWVLRDTWTIQEMRDLAEDVTEAPSLRKSITTSLTRRLRQIARFDAEYGLSPEASSEELLRKLVADRDTPLRGVALAELYRRCRKPK